MSQSRATEEASPPFDKNEFGRFLLSYPLYQKFFTKPPMGLPMNVGELLPEVIYHDCSHSNCQREQPFHPINSRYLDRDQEQLEQEIQNTSADLQRAGGFHHWSTIVAKRGVYHIKYWCSVCHSTTLQWFVELDMFTGGRAIKATSARWFFRKVGQLPPFDISVPRDIEKRFGEDGVELFKKAQISIHQSYGIGACIYLRRIIEDQINPLLEIHLETRRDEGAGEDELAKIQNIINERILENKIKLVTSVELGTTMNPVGAMYDRLSEAIHTYDDNDSTGVARDVSEMFVDLIIRLKEQRRARQEHLERLQRLRQSKRRSGPSKT